MALEKYDGFDHYNTAAQLARKWDTGSAGSTFPAGRFGGNCLRTNGTNVATATLTAQQTRVIGWAWQTDALGAGTVLTFLDAGSAQLEVRITAGGLFTVTKNGSVLGTSSATYVINTWYYMEFKCKIDPSTGTYELRQNGVSIISGSGANTRNTANSTVNQVKLIAGVANQEYDDVYILNTSGSVNNDFLGECRILMNLPTGDGNSSQWTPSTGVNHWANVDEATPNDDTDYNSDATVGHIDLFTFASISPTGTIAAVQTTLTARKDDAGARQIAEQCRSSSTNYTGATQTMNSTYGMTSEIRETDPATGIAWTTTGVNNAQFGVKVIA